MFEKGHPQYNSGRTRFKKGHTTWNKGLDKETDIRVGKIGNRTKGRTVWNKGKKGVYSEATLTKMSENRKGGTAWNTGLKATDDIRIAGGADASNWLGGKSFEPYGIEFNANLKEAIRQRDNYQCRKCGCSELENVNKLDIHHADYDKRNNHPDNLVALCHECHSRTNSNRQKWIKYFGRERKKVRSKQMYLRGKIK